MKCFYINETMLQDTLFSRNVLQRFLRYYRCHHGEVLLISAVGSIITDKIPEDIVKFISPVLFSFSTIQGEVMPYSACIDLQEIALPCSGCCIEYDTITKKYIRIYFDIINNPVVDVSEQVIDQVVSLLHGLPKKNNFYN